MKIVFEKPNTHQLSGTLEHLFSNLAEHWNTLKWGTRDTHFKLNRRCHSKLVKRLPGKHPTKDSSMGQEEALLAQLAAFEAALV